MKKAMKGFGILLSVAIIVLLTAKITWAATPQVAAGYYHTLAIKSDKTCGHGETTITVSSVTAPRLRDTFCMPKFT